MGTTCKCEASTGSLVGTLSVLVSLLDRAGVVVSVSFRDGDNRERYSAEQKIRVIKLYTEGMGLRAIERLEGISVALLIHWIRNFSKIIRAKLCSTEIPDDAKEISILEVDELFTYFQKKNQKSLCVACCGQRQE